VAPAAAGHLFGELDQAELSMQTRVNLAGTLTVAGHAASSLP
jgi:hypothetical protein